MNQRALNSMRLQTVANYWVRATPDRELARKCAWDQAEKEGLQFERKEINAAIRRAWNLTSDKERDALLTASTAHLTRGPSDAPDRKAHAARSPLGSNSGPSPGPSPGGTCPSDPRRPGWDAPESGRDLGNGEPETYELLKRYEEGLLAPRPVRLGPLPAEATESMRLVAEDIALLLGLRIAVDDDRPLMYSTWFCAWRMGWKVSSGGWDKKRASRVLNKLVSAGVISHVGDMPRTKTRLYAPPLEPAVVRPGPEVPALGIEPVVQPCVEVREQAIVDHAEAVLRNDLGVVASRDGAAAGDNGATTYAGGELHAPEIPAPPYARRN
jgi:hypothetical protein